MAYTSIIPVRRLSGSIDYITDKSKTTLKSEIGSALNHDGSETVCFQSALSCTLETAFEDMLSVKRQWHKEGGIQGYHLVQSFAPGEVSPDAAHEIGTKLAEKLLGGKYQVIITTHLNTKCIHNHILWNSVSVQDGKKYISREKSYMTEIRHISDGLCREYGLSVIDTEKPEHNARHYAQWLAERDGKPTWRYAIQQDIDSAIASSLTWNQFLTSLKMKGYAIRLDRKYITLKPPGKERPVRFKTLGPGYTPEAIQNRILYPREIKKTVHRSCTFLDSVQPKKLTGLRALYYHYLYGLGILRKKPKRLTYALREDIRMLDKRMEQAEFIFENNIQTREELSSLMDKTETQISQLVKKRHALYKGAGKESEIKSINDELKKLRHTVSMCRGIIQHSAEIEKRLEAARLEDEMLSAIQEKSNDRQIDHEQRR